MDYYSNYQNILQQFSNIVTYQYEDGWNEEFRIYI